MGCGFDSGRECWKGLRDSACTHCSADASGCAGLTPGPRGGARGYTQRCPNPPHPYIRRPGADTAATHSCVRHCTLPRAKDVSSKQEACLYWEVKIALACLCVHVKSTSSLPEKYICPKEYFFGCLIFLQTQVQNPDRILISAEQKVYNKK